MSQPSNDPCCGCMTLYNGLKTLAWMDAVCSFIPVIFFIILWAVYGEHFTGWGEVALMVFGVVAFVATVIELIIALLLYCMTKQVNRRECMGWSWIVTTVLLRIAQVCYLAILKKNSGPSPLDTFFTVAIVVSILVSVFKIYGMFVVIVCMQPGAIIPPADEIGGTMPGQIVAIQTAMPVVYSNPQNMQYVMVAPQAQPPPPTLSANHGMPG